MAEGFKACLKDSHIGVAMGSSPSVGEDVSVKKTVRWIIAKELKAEIKRPNDQKVAQTDVYVMLWMQDKCLYCLYLDF